LKCVGTRAESRFRLSTKRMSPFNSAGASVQSTTGSRGVRISGSNAGYTMFRGSVKGTGYPLYSPVSPSLPLPASPCAITFQLDSNKRLHGEDINPLNAELNSICHLLALLGVHHFLHVSRIRVKSLTFRLLMSYIYGAPILDVSRSHTTTRHSR